MEGGVARIVRAMGIDRLREVSSLPLASAVLAGSYGTLNGN